MTFDLDLYLQFDLVLTWDPTWLNSVGNHEAVGVSSERRRSSCSSYLYLVSDSSISHYHDVMIGYCNQVSHIWGLVCLMKDLYDMHGYVITPAVFAFILGMDTANENRRYIVKKAIGSVTRNKTKSPPRWSIRRGKSNYVYDIWTLLPEASGNKVLL